jgi:hypothetical protein
VPGAATPSIHVTAKRPAAAEPEGEELEGEELEAEELDVAGVAERDEELQLADSAATPTTAIIAGNTRCNAPRPGST